MTNLDDIRRHFELASMDAQSTEYAFKMLDTLQAYQDAIQYALNNIDYLRNLWGDEGVTRNVADRLRSTLKGETE